jgi:hypothetical protein
MTLKVLTIPSMLHFTIFKSLKNKNKKEQKQIKHKVFTFILLASLLSECQHISTEYIPGCTMTVLEKVYIQCTMQGRNTDIQLSEAEV